MTTSGKRSGQAGGARAKHDYVEFFCHYRASNGPMTSLLHLNCIVLSQTHWVRHA